ncbi:hypothetical protein JV33_04590 [Pectobacterium carotovorum subsp. carotovorum]|nr:hypothetical protein JV33_04590 [Pectobacterium carotovorum subsp. carotovorum]KML70271.1 hypothetical protein G032_07915 [Pectobacterium carotovorum subsp. carotovorum ICMP 5702]
MQYHFYAYHFIMNGNDIANIFKLFIKINNRLIIIFFNLKVFVFCDLITEKNEILIHSLYAAIGCI